jgi:hypothetical protein
LLSYLLFEKSTPLQNAERQITDSLKRCVALNCCTERWTGLSANATFAATSLFKKFNFN